MRASGLLSQCAGRSARIVRLPLTLARLQTAVFEYLPGEPLITRDNLDAMSVESVAHAGIAPELGIPERAERGAAVSD